MSNPLDEIQARVTATADYFSGPHDVMPTHFEDRERLLAALRAVEAVHYDSVGDCAACVDECGCCPLDYPCPTITAIREALG